MRCRREQDHIQSIAAQRIKRLVAIGSDGRCELRLVDDDDVPLTRRERRVNTSGRLM